MQESYFSNVMSMHWCIAEYNLKIAWNNKLFPFFKVFETYTVHIFIKCKYRVFCKLLFSVPSTLYCKVRGLCEGLVGGGGFIKPEKGEYAYDL